MTWKQARAAAMAQANSVHQLRTWTFTIAISATMLAVMYGLAYWHELRGHGAHQDAAPISSTR